MSKRTGSTLKARSPKKGKLGDTAFSKPDAKSDVIFEIEGKDLYFNKTLLCLTSPHFETAFSNVVTDGDIDRIRLPGGTHTDMVAFLKQIHPAYPSAESITDETIPGLLQLAREYKVESVRQSCLQYIDNEIQRFNKETLADHLLLYLGICHKHELVTQREKLLNLLKQRKMKDIKKSSHYDQVPLAVMKELAVERSLKLEKIIEKKVQPFLEQILSKSDCISGLCTPDYCENKRKCDNANDCTGFCQRCVIKKVQKFADSLK